MMRKDLVLTMTCVAAMTLTACGGGGGDDGTGFTLFGDGNDTVENDQGTLGTDPSVDTGSDVAVPGTGTLTLPDTDDLEVPDTGDVEIPDTIDGQFPDLDESDPFAPTDEPIDEDVVDPDDTDPFDPDDEFVDEDFVDEEDVGFTDEDDVGFPDEDDPVGSAGEVGDLFGLTVFAFELEGNPTQFAFITEFGPEGLEAADDGSILLVGQAVSAFSNDETGGEPVQDGSATMACLYEAEVGGFVCIALLDGDDSGLSVSFLFERPVNGFASAAVEVCEATEELGDCLVELIDAPDGAGIVSIEGANPDASAERAEALAGLSGAAPVAVDWLRYGAQGGASLDGASPREATRARAAGVDLESLRNAIR